MTETKETTSRSRRSGEGIPFNRPAITGAEHRYVSEVFERAKFSGVGPFAKRCNEWLTAELGAAAVLTTSSGTHALEMAALLCDLAPGDQVILPSYAYPTTASAFARCGAELVFVDVEPNTMNVDPQAVAAAVTHRTRVIVALHYAGVSCEMGPLLDIAARHDLEVVEDAAHAIFSAYRDRPCGTLGSLGCLSFHETKNVHCGEGGALIVNDPALLSRAEVVLEKGTDRARFFRGEVDRYTWQDLGSSYVLGELAAAFLLAQLENGEEITRNRRQIWEIYREELEPLAREGSIVLSSVPENCRHNGHIFWIKTRDLAERSGLIAHLQRRGIQSVFHYVPLHSSPAGRRYGRFVGEDRFTTSGSETLLRLPLFYRFGHAAEVARSIRSYLRGDEG